MLLLKGRRLREVSGKVKRRKKRNRRSSLWKWLTLVLLLLVAGVVFMICTDTGKQLVGKITNKDADGKKPQKLEFPVMLENGDLEINSVFQYTGANPDFQWEEGEDIGALVLINRSERYLKTADISVKLSNGEKLQFKVSDIPSGGTAWLYELENGVYPVTEYCVSAKGNAKFSKDTGLSEEQVTVKAEGMKLTLTNNTEKDLNDLIVKCHILFNEAFFGGNTYSYPVEKIPAGESVEVDAPDCILGDAKAVWIGTAK